MLQLVLSTCFHSILYIILFYVLCYLCIVFGFFFKFCLKYLLMRLTQEGSITHFLNKLLYSVFQYNVCNYNIPTLRLILSIYSVSCRKLRQKDRIYCYVLTFSLPLRQHTNTFMVIDLDPKH